MFRFSIEKKAPGLARAGTITTSHGAFDTPAFVAVGTKATVKSLTVEEIRECGIDVMLANTYHLYLQPGEKIVEAAGGLAKFMNWNGPTFTDSGGFQIFSLGAGYGKGVTKFTAPVVPESASAPAIFDEDLATSHGKLAQVDEEGVTFTSHLNGSLHRFIPERSIEIQQALGADIIFAFDECTAPGADYQYQKEAMARTHRWAERSLKAHRQNLDAAKQQALYGIVQGGLYEDLRAESADAIAAMDFDGFGIGGSYEKAHLDKILRLVNEKLPEEKPRHLLGIGSEPLELLVGVDNGIDTFDCTAATRLGRNGTFFVKGTTGSITNAKYEKQFSPMVADCSCSTCTKYTAAYLHHLFKAKEMLGSTLLSMHNLYFMAHLIKDMRLAIVEDRWEDFKKEFLKEYGE